jgi:hypothetical protein
MRGTAAGTARGQRWHKQTDPLSVINGREAAALRGWMPVLEEVGRL